MFHAILLTSVALLGQPAGAPPPELVVGDPAPKLEIREFLRGEPLGQFEKGKTYVVEFWATWCGPCRQAFPHLAALQKKHKEAIILSVSIDEDVKAAKPYVEKIAKEINYRVAIESREGDAGKMARSWLQASHQSGIPVAYIVNGDGRVAWIGQPGELDGPLEQVLAGKWDLAAAAARFKLEIAQRKQQIAKENARKEFLGRLAKALEEKRYDEALKLAEDAEAREIGREDLPPGILRLAIMVAGNQNEKAAEWGNKLLARSVHQGGDVDPAAIVVAIIVPQKILVMNPEKEEGGNDFRPVPARKLDPPLAKVAAAAADLAAAIYGDEMLQGFEAAEHRMVLARAYQAAGDKKKAAEQFKKAAESLDGIIRKAGDARAAVREAQKEVGGEDNGPRK